MKSLKWRFSSDASVLAEVFSCARRWTVGFSHKNQSFLGGLGVPPTDGHDGESRVNLWFNDG